MPIALRSPQATLSGRGFAVSERWLPAALAVIAGMVDLTSFVSLGGVFTAHITGNLVVLAAIIVRGGSLDPAQALAVPMFAVAVAAVWLAIRAGRGGALSRGVLIGQFLLIAAAMIVCVATDAAGHPHGLPALAAVLLAAAAMAAQNALLHMQIPGAPSTAVMTGNLVSAVINTLDAVSPAPDRQTVASGRLANVLLLLGGFMIGGCAAAGVLLVDRNWAWALPTGLAGVVALISWRRES
jgi:uncharacterized membrane protein YoaK (UPF0700 family)